MQQHVNYATPEHGNTIDIVITCTMNLSIQSRNARFQLKPAVNHIDMGVCVNYMKVTNTCMKTEDPSVDKMLGAFKSTLSTILNKHAPLKKYNSKHNPIPGITCGCYTT